MARITKLTRSNNAHLRLRAKHADTPGKKGDVLYRYHHNILNIQKAKKKIVSKAERRRIFAIVSKRVYKTNKKR